MKIALLTLLGLCLATGLKAQNADDAAATKRSPEELQELLGPIALYPDPLISLVLPASSVPSDIVLADRFVGGGGDANAVDDKPWDASVKSLTHYPDTLKWLDDNLDWTTQVGDAFVSQPVEVMEAIQALRAKAKSLGNLVDTPQERIVQDDNDIRIVPAEAESISVPTYDSEVVYTRSAPVVAFSEPYVVGPWMRYDVDWHHRHLYWGDWHRGWDYSRGHEREIFLDNHIRKTTVWHVDPKRRIVEMHHPVAVHVTGSHVVIPHPKHVVLPRGTRTEVITEGRGHVIAPRTMAPGAGRVREEEHKVHMEEHKAAAVGAKLHEEERKVHMEEHKAAAVGAKVREEEHKVHAEEHRAAAVGAKVHEEEHKVHVEEHKAHAEGTKVREEEHKRAEHKKDERKP